MSLTLVDTAGSASANTYIAVDDADDYHATTLYATDWLDAPTATKNAALVWATRLLDQHFTWSGFIASHNQALSWPRASTYDKDGRLLAEDTIPDAIANATAELAKGLIAEDRTDSDTQSGAIQYVTVGQIAVKYSTGTINPITVIPDAVRAMVSHLGTYASVNSGAITVRRG